MSYKWMWMPVRTGSYIVIVNTLDDLFDLLDEPPAQIVSGTLCMHACI